MREYCAHICGQKAGRLWLLLSIVRTHAHVLPYLSIACHLPGFFLLFCRPAPESNSGAHKSPSTARSGMIPTHGSRELIIQQTCRSSFSAVSRPSIATTCSFCNIHFSVLQPNVHFATSTILKINNTCALLHRSNFKLQTFAVVCKISVTIFRILAHVC